MKPSVLFSTVLCVLAIPAVASAQDQIWLKDRSYSQGPGYRVGDFELHPGAAIEFGYDSNYYRRAAAEDPLGALRLRITPSFSFQTLGSQRREGSPAPTVDFKGGIALSYNEFIPIQGSQVEKNLMQQQRNLGANVDLGLNLFPGRTWSGAINAGFARVLTASEQGATQSFSSTGTFNRDVPSFGAELIWTPGAGLFEWRLGGAVQGTVFESIAQLTNVNATVETRGRWRFLPRTSLLFDGKFGFITYPAASGAAQKTSSHPMRALIGISGLVTPSFSLLAQVGWGASFYANPSPTMPSENFDSVIGQVELKWFLQPQASADAAVTASNSSISVGFLRDFYDSYIGTYFERDRGYAALSYLYGGKFLIVVDGGAGPMLYPKITSLGVMNSFTDIRIDAGLFAEYRFKDFLGINASFRYNENISHTSIMVTGGAQDDLSYREIEAYLGFRWLM